jgi:hypothetical protein
MMVPFKKITVFGLAILSHQVMGGSPYVPSTCSIRVLNITCVDATDGTIDCNNIALTTPNDCEKDARVSFFIRNIGSQSLDVIQVQAEFNGDSVTPSCSKVNNIGSQQSVLCTLPDFTFNGCGGNPVDLEVDASVVGQPVNCDTTFCNHEASKTWTITPRREETPSPTASPTETPTLLPTNGKKWH